MEFKQSLRGLLEQDLSRTEFLKRIGIGILALIGITKLLPMLAKSTQPSRTTRTGGGYGKTINLRKP